MKSQIVLLAWMFCFPISDRFGVLHVSLLVMVKGMSGIQFGL